MELDSEKNKIESSNVHPSCTCRMGTDTLSVVDPLTMRVHGLDGLRIVDASVMPYITNGICMLPG